MKKLMATALVLLFTASAAEAACTRADLTGTWQLYTVFDSVGRCTLIMPSSGSKIGSDSYCYLPGVASSVPFTGNISLGSNCHLTGQITASTLQRKIDAWISKGKDSVAGMAWDPDNPYYGDIFSGVKK